MKYILRVICFCFLITVGWIPIMMAGVIMNIATNHDDHKDYVREWMFKAFKWAEFR